MSHVAACCLERTHHVQTPHGEWPGDGDGLEDRGWQVLLGAELLAPFALLDQLFGVVQSSRPEEAMAESFGYEGPGGGMVAAFALMDIPEDFHALLWFHAALKDAGHTPSCEFLVDDGIGAYSALDLSG